MSNLDTVVIVAGLLMGYWIVSKALDHKANQRAMGVRDTGSRRWNEVLGVPYSASEAEIEAAYRKLMAQYHPDRVSQLGDDMRSMAETKAREIDKAYAEVMHAIRVSGRK